jgi:hypothetical protein
MSEAAAPAPSAPVETNTSAPVEASAPANDNAVARTIHDAPPANDNAAPSAAVDDVYHAENLGDLGEKKWRLRNGDQERVVDTKELLRLSQIGHAGYDAFRKAAEREKAVTAKEETLRSQVAELQRGFKESPLQMLRRMGLEDRLYADLEQELQYQQLPDHERARHDLDRERQRLEQERSAWQQQQEQVQRQAAEAQLAEESKRYEQTFLRDYNAALDAAGMPQSEKVRSRAIRLMAQMHERALSSGVEVPVDVLARQAQDELAELGRAYVGSAPPEKARELLGEDWIRGVQQHDVQRVQQSRAPNGQFVPKQGEAPRAAPQSGQTRQRFSSMRDFQRALDGKTK